MTQNQTEQLQDSSFPIFWKLTLFMIHSYASALMYWLTFAPASLNKHLTGQLHRHVGNKVTLGISKSGGKKKKKEYQTYSHSRDGMGCRFSHHSVRLPVSDRWNRFNRRTFSQQVTSHQVHSWTHRDTRQLQV